MKNIYSNILKLAVGVLILFGLFYKVGILEIVNVLGSTNLILFLIATILFVLFHILNAGKFYLLILPISSGLSFSRFLKYYFVSRTASLLLPGKIGDFSILYLLKEYGVNIGKGSAAIVSDRLITLIITGVVGIIGLFIFLPAKQVSLFLLICAVCAFVFLTFFTEGARKLLKKLLPKRIAKSFSGFFSTMLSYVKHYKGKIFLNLFLSLVGLIINSISAFFLFLAVGAKIPLIYVILISSVTNIVLLIPITINGLGLVQAAGLFLYMKLGISADVIGAGLVLAIIMTYGVGFLLFIRFHNVIGKHPKK